MHISVRTKTIEFFYIVCVLPVFCEGDAEYGAPRAMSSSPASARLSQLENPSTAHQAQDAMHDNTGVKLARQISSSSSSSSSNNDPQLARGPGRVGAGRTALPEDPDKGATAPRRRRSLLVELRKARSHARMTFTRTQSASDMLRPRTVAPVPRPSPLRHQVPTQQPLKVPERAWGLVRFFSCTVVSTCSMRKRKDSNSVAVGPGW